ncbi:MAG: hypothetical protein PHC34_05460 [Candidatus Gastranaerophilales bacterium]|nr:hypothetical protein [Candidatus Gastranaerophilales bacterium]
MLPIITEEIRENIVNEALQDVNSWRKQMIHYIKEENPEVNSAIIEAANSTELDPKGIALGAYMTYKMLELARDQEGASLEELFE